MKCPNCESENFVELKADNNFSYVLTVVDLSQSTPDFKPHMGRPVQLRACQKCGLAFLFAHRIK